MAVQICFGKLNDGHCHIGTVVGDSFAVDKQVGEIYTKFRTALAASEPCNMFITDR